MSHDKEQIGSVVDEATKLLGALQDWARDNGHESATAAAGAASAFKTVNAHIATGGDDCTFCPVCRLISVARQASPEVKQHLSTAASSLLKAAAAAMPTDAQRNRDESASPLEKIDLSDEAWPQD